MTPPLDLPRNSGGARRKKERPLVSIGLPVYNGENYLREAIDSILGQDFEDFELIISDNGSTDGTGAICLEAVARDPRVQYHRVETNRGMAWNFNRSFELAGGRYFAWVGHDDRLGREYIERCAEVLERDDGVVLCFSNANYIDGSGNLIRKVEFPNDAISRDAAERFKNIIRLNHKCDAICGLIRTKVLKETRLLGKFADCDRVLLAELGLRGRFHCIPDHLFSRREHPLQSTARFPGRQERTALFDPTLAGKTVYPHLREFLELTIAIRSAPLSFRERLRCHRHLLRWLSTYRKRMTDDLIIGCKYTIKRFLKACRA